MAIYSESIKDPNCNTLKNTIARPDVNINLESSYRNLSRLAQVPLPTPNSKNNFSAIQRFLP